MKSSSKFKDPSELILIGKIVAAHGVKGAVKVISFAESIEIFYSIDALWTPCESRSEAFIFDRLEPSWVKPFNKNIRMGFKEIGNRDQAEALAGRELYLEKSRLPQLEDDTYYWFELIGLLVKTEADEIIGRIKAILPTGGNDVYVVEPTNHNYGKELLIPAVANVIQHIDVAEKTMIVDLPEGLKSS